MKYSKGAGTKKAILEQARKTFNEKGLTLTIDALAREMGVTKSSISNHFSTKDLLFKAIMEDYEQSLSTVAAKFRGLMEEPKFDTYAEVINIVMDVQYEYRSGIVYSNMVTPYQVELSDHIKANYKRNTDNIRKRVNYFIKKRYLTKRILLPENYDVFVFQFTTLLTTWVISLQMYQPEDAYPKIKPLYLKSALSCYKPFMTAKGLADFENIDFDRFSTMAWTYAESQNESS